MFCNSVCIFINIPSGSGLLPGQVPEQHHGGPAHLYVRRWGQELQSRYLQTSCLHKSYFVLLLRICQICDRLCFVNKSAICNLPANIGNTFSLLSISLTLFRPASISANIVRTYLCPAIFIISQFKNHAV